MEITRRSFLPLLIAAPAIVRYSSLMSVKAHLIPVRRVGIERCVSVLLDDEAAFTDRLQAQIAAMVRRAGCDIRTAVVSGPHLRIDLAGTPVEYVTTAWT